MAIVLIALLALASRLPQLNLRPLHTDEAVHMVKAGILLETGSYEYNPHEYHGPTIYYCAIPLLWLQGSRTLADVPSATPFLLVPVVFSIATILLMLLLKRGIGAGAAVLAAALAAASPGLAFYSRYYIQETLLVFFAAALIVCVWRYTLSRSAGWVVAIGIISGMALATKESFVIIGFALLAAGAASRLYAPHLHPVRGVNYQPQVHTRLRFLLGGRVNQGHVVAGILIGVFTATALLSAGFTNPRAIVDGVLSYGHYVYRAMSGDSSTHGIGLHNHPWYWYFANLSWFKVAPGPSWSEGFILLLALLGIIRSLKLHRSPDDYASPFLLCSFAFYAIFTTVVFSALPYKTPWNAMPMLHGLVIMAGAGGSWLWHMRREWWWRSGILLLLGLGIAHLSVQNWRANFRYYADYRNPYVYAGTSYDCVKMADRVLGVAKVHPHQNDMVVKVIAPKSDYWPLPWYIRTMKNVGYYTEIPALADGPVIIANSDLDDQLSSTLTGNYNHEYFGLRADVFMSVYTEKRLWEKYLEQRK